jgi:hypothetical protein
VGREVRADISEPKFGRVLEAVSEDGTHGVLDGGPVVRADIVGEGRCSETDHADSSVHVMNVAKDGFDFVLLGTGEGALVSFVSYLSKD